MFTSRRLLTIAAALGLVPFASAYDEPTLEQRLEKLAESLEEARSKAHVPGMSIAIVKDDAVVWARGFGLADIESGRAADESTIYAIGSTTKAFTATLVGTLVDEGIASWDDPVTKFLPYFDLDVRSDDPDAACTLRDLLCHRHGFARMSMLWLSGGLSREEILRTAVGAEPWDEFRAGFHYCNVTYMAAGVAAGAAVESSWDELMAQRILAPLGMSSSTLTTSAAREDARLARGYRWEPADRRVEHMEMFDLSAVGPAGSVNSNVLDMAQWLRLQLHEGEVDGERVISAESLRETWTPQIEIVGGVEYGLGWMLREHDGRRVVEHGGNIDGFSAQVGMIPEEDLGFVLLMNLDASPLQQPSLALVFDALLDEWPGETKAAADTDGPAQVELDDYVGTYIANFGSFDDAEFEVEVSGDRLALAIPGQGTTDLAPPDAEGRWVAAISAQVAVSFQRDEQDAVVGLTVHQGKMNFEVPREGVEILPEVPAERLERFTGRFVRAEGGRHVEIVIEKGRLAMRDKGQLLQFHTPDEDGHAVLRFRSDWGATFKSDAEGRVESFVFHGRAGDRLFTRLVDPGKSELATVDEVLALRGTDARISARKKASGTKISGSVRFPQAGVSGALTIHLRGADEYALLMDCGKFGRISAATIGGDAWRYNPMHGARQLKGDDLTQAMLGHPDAVEGDWRAYFDSIDVVRSESLEGRECHIVRLVKTGLPPRQYWVDAEHGDVLRVDQTMIERSVRMPITVTYSQFEDVGGIRTPMRIESKNPATGSTVMVIETIETGLALGDEVFSVEQEGAK